MSNKLEWKKDKLAMLNKAIIIATTYHAGQVDKCGQAYILHPLRVMLTPTLITDQERIVAVLHDVLEDTTCLIETLHEFDEDIVEALIAITHLNNESQLDYLSRVKANPLALTVKLADINDNLMPFRLDRLPLIERERLIEKYGKYLLYLRNQKI